MSRTLSHAPSAMAATFALGGEMGRQLADLDWSGNPIGHPDTWPQSLRTATSICLTSRFPLVVWWGPELVMLYNDAYRPITGDKHPESLGRRGREVWPEIWDVIGPMLEQARSGVATWSEDQLLWVDRQGFPEECYFTFSYSPIHDESGGVGGVFTAVTETTGRVIGERRLEALKRLAEDAVRGDGIEAAAAAAVKALDAFREDLPFVALQLAEGPGGAGPTVDGAPTPGGAGALFATVLAPDERDAVGRWLQGAWERADAGPVGDPGAGTRVTLDEIGLRVEDPWGTPVAHALVVPVGEAAGTTPRAFLLAGLPPRQPPSSDAAGFVELVAGQIARVLATAEALEVERRRTEELAALDRAKTEFFGNISHEFRTPLTLMLGPLDALLERDLDDAAREQLALVRRNALRLLRLVNTLLDFTRVDRGTVDLAVEPVDLAALTADVASAYRSAIESFGLAFDVHCEPLPHPVLADPARWEQIVLNLLSNALKFTHEGRISVALRADGPSAVLEVADTGIGIDPADQPRVFDRFQRVRDVRSRTYEGSGIGLALVKELVARHGGDVTLTSAPGAGSTFRVRVPLDTSMPAANGRVRVARTDGTAAGAYVDESLRWRADAATPPAEAIVGQPSGPALPRILVVDDNADIRAYLRRLLGEIGRVDAVADGSAALAAIRTAPPDLVVLDVMMPGLDGREVVAAIRADDRTRLLPVILLSARAGEEARVDGLESGADDYLVKPFTGRELLARVRTQLALAEARREALELREAFLGVLSHELRTPVTTVFGGARLLLRPGLDEATRAGLLADIAADADRLQVLIDDLLVLARAERRAVPMGDEPVLLGHVARQVVGRGEERWSGRQVVLHVQPGLPPASGDAVYAEQAIRNLVSNAAKYSAPDTPIEVRVDAAEGEVRLRVLDEGVGIAGEEGLFELFYRSPRVSERVGGAGIGLYVVRRVVAAMGGRVWARPRPEGGSEFGFALPMLPVDGADAG